MRTKRAAAAAVLTAPADAAIRELARTIWNARVKLCAGDEGAARRITEFHAGKRGAPATERIILEEFAKRQK
jgi:hypothetical protein